MYVCVLSVTHSLVHPLKYTHTHTHTHTNTHTHTHTFTLADSTERVHNDVESSHHATNPTESIIITHKKLGRDSESDSKNRIAKNSESDSKNGITKNSKIDIIAHRRPQSRNRFREHNQNMAEDSESDTTCKKPESWMYARAHSLQDGKENHKKFGRDSEADNHGSVINYSQTCHQKSIKNSETDNNHDTNSETFLHHVSMRHNQQLYSASRTSADSDADTNMDHAHAFSSTALHSNNQHAYNAPKTLPNARAHAPGKRASTTARTSNQRLYSAPKTPPGSNLSRSDSTDALPEREDAGLRIRPFTEAVLRQTDAFPEREDAGRRVSSLTEAALRKRLMAAREALGGTSENFL
jgi:hypothetical protein